MALGGQEAVARWIADENAVLCADADGGAVPVRSDRGVRNLGTSSVAQNAADPRQGRVAADRGILHGQGSTVRYGAAALGCIAGQRAVINFRHPLVGEPT